MDIEPSDPRAAGAAVHLGLAVLHLRAGARAASFIMFLPDGIPVRARLTVTFNEYRNVDLEAKEVKRETADYSKRHVVEPGRDAVRRSPAPSTAIRGCGA